MRGVVFLGGRQVEVANFPVPKPGPGSARRGLCNRGTAPKRGLAGDPAGRPARHRAAGVSVDRPRPLSAGEKGVICVGPSSQGLRRSAPVSREGPARPVSPT